MDLEKISQIVVALCGVALIIIVGFIVVQRMGNDYFRAEGFCINKEGIWNVSEYDSFLDYDTLNCSDKNHYGMATNALAEVS